MTNIIPYPDISVGDIFLFIADEKFGLDECPRLHTGGKNWSDIKRVCWLIPDKTLVIVVDICDYECKSGQCYANRDTVRWYKVLTSCGNVGYEHESNLSAKIFFRNINALFET